MERELFEVAIVIVTAVIAHLETKRRLMKGFEGLLTTLFKSYNSLLDGYEAELFKLKKPKN